MITKPQEHETDRAGKRLLREALESLGWVVNEVQEDYGIDFNVQVFDQASPTGVWFHIQLKSSGCSNYSADRGFISQELSKDHARHYALEMREPVLVVHADVRSECSFWYAPQLDRQLATVIGDTNAQSVTVRIPTVQQLPGTAPALLTSLSAIHLTLSNRELTSASTRSFAESLKHMADQEALRRAFQEKNDALKLHRVRDLYRSGKLEEARTRTDLLLADPDSTIEVKFWARIQLQSIDYHQTLHSGGPQGQLPKILLEHARALQKLTKSGPKYLKFYALIVRQAAELDILSHDNFGVFMALHQHLSHHGDPMMALGLYVRESLLTKQIVAKYNRCLRLVRYAMNYTDRWMLGRALTQVVNGIGPYLVTLRAQKIFEPERALSQSALHICKIAAGICQETGDPEGIELAMISALATTSSADSDAYHCADQVAHGFTDPEIRNDALLLLERTASRWRGERVEGDYEGDAIWQITQNIATSLGIDLSDENDPLVLSLKIAAKDNTPERILRKCEHIVVSFGAIGPKAQLIQRLFNIGTAASKVIHCTIHDYHVEGKELDSAYEVFKQRHCQTCPDAKPRAEPWRYTDEERMKLEAQHYDFVSRFVGTPYGKRYTNED